MQVRKAIYFFESLISCHMIQQNLPSLLTRKGNSLTMVERIPPVVQPQQWVLRNQLT